VLSVSQDLFSFTTAGLTNAPPAQTLTIENTGGDMLNWTIAEPNSCEWLTATPAAGQTLNGTPVDVSLSVDPVVAGAGVHTCELIVSDGNADNSPQTVTVTFNVLQPVIHLFAVNEYGHRQLDFEFTAIVSGFDEPIEIHGDYILEVPYGWSGTIIPAGSKVQFDPNTLVFEDVTQLFNQTPITIKHLFSGGDGSQGDPFWISDANDLRNLSYDTSSWDKYFVVINDIDMGDPNVINMGTIGDFTGSLDGQGFTITNPTANGILIGSNHGTIQNCIVEYGDTTLSCGFVGANYGTIGNCDVKDVYVEISQGAAGGLARVSYGLIDGCSVSGTVIGDYCVGGLVGWSGGESGNILIQNSSANCIVRGNAAVGGLVGMNKADVYNCSTYGEVTGVYSVGGLIGDSFDDVVDCRSEGLVRGNMYATGGLIGLAHTKFTGESTQILNCSSSADVMPVDNAGPNSDGSFGGLIGAAEGYPGEIVNCYATGDVTGTSSSTGGLVGYLSGWGVRRCYATGDVNGTYAVGGLIGNAYSYEYPIEKCYAVGDVTGQEGVGGLIGNNRSDVSQCFSMGAVIGIGNAGGAIGIMGSGYRISDCYVLGDISGDSHVGGFLGSGSGATTFRHCYVANAVSGNTNAGLFTGVDINGNYYDKCFYNLDNNYANLPALGGNYPSDPNVIGVSTDEMMMRLTYTNWLFDSGMPSSAGVYWRMCADGLHYPKLAWEFSRKGDFVCGDGVDADDLAQLAVDWLVEGTSLADANFDGKVNLEDMAVLGKNWLKRFAYFDVVDDGIINMADVGARSGDWGDSGTGLPADVWPEPNGDGVVDVQDLLLVAEYWLCETY
jgi:hypothetical protein